MIQRPAPEDERCARFLIPDTTPLSLLALVGEEALDWLFVPGAEVWITDMVREEAIRDPDPDDDQRPAHRAAIRAWLERNGGRILIQVTDEGEEYRKAMEAWRLAGCPPELKPTWRGRGERSILQVLDAAERARREGEAVIIIADDAKARAALRLHEGLDIDLMATESFIEWMASAFGIREAETAWITIQAACGGKAPDRACNDPVYIRRPL